MRATFVLKETKTPSRRRPVSFTMMNPDGYIQEQIQDKDAGYEPGIRYALHQLYMALSPQRGIQFIDVGSGHGFYPCMLKKRYGNCIYSHAIEPDPETFLVLKENLDRNDVFGEAHNIALTDNGADSYIHDRRLVFTKPFVEKAAPIKTTTLGDFYNPGTSTVVMIDAGGSEGLVLKGAKNILPDLAAVILRLRPKQELVRGFTYLEMYQMLVGANMQLYECDRFYSSNFGFTNASTAKLKDNLVHKGNWSKESLEHGRVIIATHRIHNAAAMFSGR